MCHIAVVSGRWSVVRPCIYRALFTFHCSPFTKMWHVPHLNGQYLARALLGMEERAFGLQSARLEGVKNGPISSKIPPTPPTPTALTPSRTTDTSRHNSRTSDDTARAPTPPLTSHRGIIAETRIRHRVPNDRARATHFPAWIEARQPPCSSG